MNMGILGEHDGRKHESAWSATAGNRQKRVLLDVLYYVVFYNPFRLREHSQYVAIAYG
jgi:hypothetical protein